MEENERFLKALKSLIELKEATTDEILKSASKEELERYISLSEEIEAKLKTILGE